MNFTLQNAVIAYRGKIRIPCDGSDDKEKDELDTHEFAILLLLTHYARLDDPLHEVYPGVQLLADAAHMSTRQVYRVLKSLVTKQFLEQAGRKGHTTCYKFRQEKLGFSTEKLHVKHPKKTAEVPEPPARDWQPPAGDTAIDADWLPAEPGSARWRIEQRTLLRKRAEKAFGLS